MKQPELLRKQADMMDMAEKYEIDDWRKLVKAKTGGLWYGFAFVGGSALSSLYEDYRFALGVVEGKPVFEGDKGWSNYLNRLVVVAGFTTHAHWRYEDCTDYFDQTDFSWTPPKPKTVTVELLRENAEFLASTNTWLPEFVSLSQACRKALEEQK